MVESIKLGGQRFIIVLIGEDCAGVQKEPEGVMIEYGYWNGDYETSDYSCEWLIEFLERNDLTPGSTIEDKSQKCQGRCSEPELTAHIPGKVRDFLNCGCCEEIEDCTDCDGTGNLFVTLPDISQYWCGKFQDWFTQADFGGETIKDWSSKYRGSLVVKNPYIIAIPIKADQILRGKIKV